MQELRRVITLSEARDLARFEYLLRTVPLSSPIWNSYSTIAERLGTGWRDQDEKILTLGNATYLDTVTQLAAAEARGTDGRSTPH